MQAQKIYQKPYTSFFLLVILLTFTFFARLDIIPLRIWDEARNANNALSIFLDGHWLVPYYEGSPDMWNTKPPLLIWLQVISMKIFGVSDLAVRIPAASGAFLTGLLIWWFCWKKLNDHWLGFIAACVFLSAPALIDNHGGRTGDYDPLLLLFMLGYCLSFYLFLIEEKKKWIMFFWILLILAVLTKGIVGILLLPGLALFTLFSKKLVLVLKEPIFYSGLIGFIILIGGYYFGREQVNPGYLQAVYENELGGRYGKGIEGHQHPFGFYTKNLFTLRFAYWAWFIIPAFVFGLIQKNKEIKTLSLFNFFLLIPFWLIISIAQTKLDWYDLPAYPFLALQTGILCYALIMLPGVRSKYFPALRILVFILLFLAPFIKTYKGIFHYRENQDYMHHQPGYFLKHASKKKMDLSRHVVCFEGYNGQIAFYINQHQLKGNHVRLQGDVGGLKPGDYAMINQQSLREQIMKSYSVKQTDEKFGCTVYLVLEAYEP